MNDDNIFRKIEKFIAILCWRIYVRIYWRKNRLVRDKLTKDIAENLGVHLFSYKDNIK